MSVFAFAFPSFSSPDIPISTTSVACDDSALNSDTGTVNIEIEWEPNEIQLYWYADSNSTDPMTVVSESQECTYDGTLTPPQTIPTKTGYTFKGWRVRGLPAGYTRVNGVTNSAGLQLYTGIKDDVDDMEYELLVKPSTGSWYIMQSRPGGTNGDIYGISGSLHNNTIIFGVGGSGSVTSNIIRDTTHTYYVKGTHKNGVATLYVLDKTTGISDTQTTTYSNYTPSSNPMVLFGNNNPSQTVAVGNTIYMAHIKKNGVLVRDYVPAVNSSNQVGLWDRVNQNFISNANLSAGAPITQ